MHDQRIALPDKIQMAPRLAASHHEVLGRDLEPVDRWRVGKDLGKVLDPKTQAKSQIGAGLRRQRAGVVAALGKAKRHDQPTVPPTLAQAGAGNAMKP